MHTHQIHSKYPRRTHRCRRRRRERDLDLRWCRRRCSRHKSHLADKTTAEEQPGTQGPIGTRKGRTSSKKESSNECTVRHRVRRNDLAHMEVPVLEGSGGSGGSCLKAQRLAPLLLLQLFTMSLSCRISVVLCHTYVGEHSLYFNHHDWFSEPRGSATHRQRLKTGMTQRFVDMINRR